MGSFNSSFATARMKPSLAILSLVVIFLTLFSVGVGGKSKSKSKCKFNETELVATVKTFKKTCLAKGFESSCANSTLSKKSKKLEPTRIDECKQIEDLLVDCDCDCDYSCADPVNGGWSDYGKWTKCTKTCGGGTRNRTRSCTNPAPAKGGRQCGGKETESEKCNTQKCPRDGGWSDYGKWSKCSENCGGGSQSRKRSCTRPAPAYGGKKCSGKDTESQRCNTQKCPRDGGWSDWGKWSKCSKTCGGGTQTRKRSCRKPAPAYGGKKCGGKDTESQKCNTQKCPRDGRWTDWGKWSKCKSVWWRNDDPQKVLYETCSCVRWKKM